MSDMIEQVAQALYAQGAANSNYPNHYRWETADEAERERGYGMARTAIAAMREPTLAMTEAAIDEAGWRAVPHDPATESGVAIECGMSQKDADDINVMGRAAMGSTWNAMIDAALKGDGQG